MTTHSQFITTLKRTFVLALSISAAASLTWSALADDRDHDHGKKSNPLLIKGYQAYTNVGFVNPANPTILQVRTGGDGGVSHLGKMRSWSTDQQGNLVTGEITAHYTFEDEKGDRLLLSALGSSAFQPDGRITFAGSFTVVSGTGRFKKAKGTLHFDGWARTTDFATGVGIGFLTIEGVIEGTKIESDPPLVVVEKGIGTLSGLDFIYEGTGVANGVGRFRGDAHNVAGPVNGFVGIVDGRFAIVETIESTWTTRDGDRIKFSGIELVYFELAAGGPPAPDFTKPSRAELYATVERGTGDFKHAQGVVFNKGSFTPTSPTTVAAELRGVGFLSDEDHD